MTPRVVPLGAFVDPALLSTTDLAGTNRAHVLQALADNGPLSRADLARRAGVSRASIGGIVAGLLDEGVLRELPVQTGTGRVGKPSRPLWFDDGDSYGAVVVQPGGVEVAVVGSNGRIQMRERIAMPAGQVTDFDAATPAAIHQLLRPHAASLRAVGLAVPAVFDSAGALVASTTIAGLVGSELPRRLAEAFDTTIVLEDDARSLAIGQRWFGQARGEKAFAALQIGEGIGAGIMLAGRLYRGPRMVSEVGHTTVDLNGGRCRCGLDGCWETVASLQWLRARAAAVGLTATGLTGDSAMTPVELTRRHEAGERRATTLLEEYADHVAVGIVNLYHTLSIPLFILHGAVTGAGEPFLDLLRRQAQARTMPAIGTAPQIIFASHEPDAGILGAAAAAATFTLGVRI